MERAGLGMSRSAANDSKAEDQFAQGNSKYYKTVLFTKSEASNDLSKGLFNLSQWLGIYLFDICFIML